MEKLVIVPMLVALVALGVYPKPVLDAVTPAVQRTVALPNQGTAMTYDPPSIAYGALSPMLIVLGAAVVGVLLGRCCPVRCGSGSSSGWLWWLLSRHSRRWLSSHRPNLKV